MMSTFSPLDLLSMVDSEQEVFRCISKHSDLTLSEIAERTEIPVAELEELLDQMIRKSRVVEQLKDGKRTFAIRFTRTKAEVRNLPQEILNIYGQSSEDFLSEVPLASQLPPAERQKLLELSSERTLMPNEVLVWQGKPFEYIGLVRSGLLKQTRLQTSQSTEQVVGYTRHLEWFGLNAALKNTPSLRTHIAVTQTDILIWSVKDILDFAQNNSHFSFALSQWLSQQLFTCQSQKVHGLGKMWAVESIHEGAGSTTLAVNLAYLVAQPNGRQYRTLLWNLNSEDDSLRQYLDVDESAVNLYLPGQDSLYQVNGVDVLLSTKRSDYPLRAQVDILLTHLRSVYDYIICDTGVLVDDELTLRFRGQAETLLTVTDDAGRVSEGQKRWNRLHAYSNPTQKRLLVLNKAKRLDEEEIPPAFHVILPEDKVGVQEASKNRQPLVRANPAASLSQALAEVYNRLSLTHSIGIFIPSTLDVDKEIDNTQQVQMALSFLGTVFGGATSSEADGVWRSEKSDLVAERVTIVRTFVSERLLRNHLDEVIDFATKLKSEMKQEAIAVDVDNQLVLV